jgi:hypothetical protein
MNIPFQKALIHCDVMSIRRALIVGNTMATVPGLEGQDIAFWRVSPPPTPPHNVADLSEFIMASSFAATLRGGGHVMPCERLRFTIQASSMGSVAAQELPLFAGDYGDGRLFGRLTPFVSQR